MARIPAQEPGAEVRALRWAAAIGGYRRDPAVVERVLPLAGCQGEQYLARFGDGTTGWCWADEISRRTPMPFTQPPALNDVDRMKTIRPIAAYDRRNQRCTDFGAAYFADEATLALWQSAAVQPLDVQVWDLDRSTGEWAMRPGHRLLLVDDDTYPHLVNPQCPCGWKVTGFIRREIVDLFYDRHLTC